VGELIVVLEGVVLQAVVDSLLWKHSADEVYSVK